MFALSTHVNEIVIKEILFIIGYRETIVRCAIVRN